jgi:hypothetical protein
MSLGAVKEVLLIQRGVCEDGKLFDCQSFQTFSCQALRFGNLLRHDVLGLDDQVYLRVFRYTVHWLEGFKDPILIDRWDRLWRAHGQDSSL